MLEVTVLGKHTQYIGIPVIEGRQIREPLMLSTAELGRKLNEKSIRIDSVLKMKIWVKLVGFDQTFIRHSLLCVFFQNCFRKHVEVNMQVRCDAQ